MSSKRERKANGRSELRKSLAETVDVMEYILDFEVFLFLVWVTLMVIALSMKLNELTFLILSSLHSGASYAALLCLKFFRDKERASVSKFTNLEWQVPTIISLATDVLLAVGAYVLTLGPIIRGQATSTHMPLWLAWVVLVFTVVLALTSLIYLILFFVIQYTTKAMETAKGYNNV